MFILSFSAIVSPLFRHTGLPHRGIGIVCLFCHQLFSWVVFLLLTYVFANWLVEYIYVYLTGDSDRIARLYRLNADL